MTLAGKLKGVVGMENKYSSAIPDASHQFQKINFVDIITCNDAVME